MVEALEIHVTGIVQGVGFRPFVYRLAKRNLINGWVLNAPDGVTIHAEGESQLLDGFVLEIAQNAPASARVKKIDLKEIPLQGYEDFQIRFSEEGEREKSTLVSPDLGICDDCARELLDPEDRRFRYPFINCTNCGPRFTIIEDLPYDRCKTVMDAFPMCDDCAREYGDPSNRRFHAQPDACFECGPSISYAECPGGAFDPAIADARADDRVLWGRTRGQSDGILSRAVALLSEGGILAVKGLGGFHLACDAHNRQAVSRLRDGKRRPTKPFAVMVRDVEAARAVCEVGEEEAHLLESPQRPIVLLRKKADADIPEGIADGLAELGVMLPASPVQYLLMHDFDGMLVMTSGNACACPIETDDLCAYGTLAGIADAFLGNDRPILARYDDSVLRVVQAGSAGATIQMIRRARGYAPTPVPFPYLEDGAPALLATGPEQKCTFCLARPGEAFVSQHIGDMESPRINDAWSEARETFQALFGIHPERLACDDHPEYLTGKWARAQDLPVTEVQHHHAHIASAMAENGLEGAVCGIAFDGTGFGKDGCLWGGEVMIANLQAFERFANLAYFPLPGGSAAIRDLTRCAFGALWAFDLLEHPAARPLIEGMGQKATLCEQMIEQGLNCPYTSSMGRLFDAASAILGICRESGYEGEGAVLLEASMAGCAPAEADRIPEGYRIDVVKNVANEGSTAQDTSVLMLDPAPLFQAMLDDIAAGTDPALVARRFHDAIVDAVLLQAQMVEAMYGITTVVLCGGVFMNRYLLERCLAKLEESGYTVAINRELPPNDGGISFGQAVVAAQSL